MFVFNLKLLFIYLVYCVLYTKVQSIVYFLQDCTFYGTITARYTICYNTAENCSKSYIFK